MREQVEFRVREQLAKKYLPDGIGEYLGDNVRKVVVQTNDPLYTEIGRIDRQLRERGGYLYLGRRYHRLYTKEELESAKLFQIKATRQFGSAGELCGTLYDETAACPGCGAGVIQTNDLHIDLRKVPRSVDFAETIAGEQIVSQRFAESALEDRLTGFNLRRISYKARYEDDALDPCEVPTGRILLRRAEVEGVPHPTWQFWVWLNRPVNKILLDEAYKEYAEKQSGRNARRRPLPIWYQLRIDAPPVEICPPTRAGDDPFDYDSGFRCSRGDTIGLTLLSEVTVARESVSSVDFLQTRQMVGLREGVLRPRPILLCSPGAFKLIKTRKLKGFKFEVAHLSEEPSGSL